MRNTARLLALALAVGVVAGTGFWVSLAVADQFSDVPAGSAFVDDVDWLTDHDIASGFPDGTFRPTAPINRQQASRWFRNYNAGLHLVTASVNPDPATTFTAMVDCPDGERALMGSGAVSDGLDLTLADSYANETYQWLVRYDAPGNAMVDPTQVQATALCGPDF
jgi:hypothetical protein